MRGQKKANAPSVELMRPLPEKGATICCVNRTLPGQRRRRFLLLCVGAARPGIHNISAKVARRMGREFDVDVESIVLWQFEEPEEIVRALALALFGKEAALTCKVFQ